MSARDERIRRVCARGDDCSTDGPPEYYARRDIADCGVHVDRLKTVDESESRAPFAAAVAAAAVNIHVYNILMLLSLRFFFFYAARSTRRAGRAASWIFEFTVAARRRTEITFTFTVCRRRGVYPSRLRTGHYDYASFQYYYYFHLGGFTH